MIKNKEVEGTYGISTEVKWLKTQLLSSRRAKKEYGSFALLDVAVAGREYPQPHILFFTRKWTFHAHMTFLLRKQM